VNYPSPESTIAALGGRTETHKPRNDGSGAAARRTSRPRLEPMAQSAKVVRRKDLAHCAEN
jgi:hypothetical protein